MTRKQISNNMKNITIKRLLKGGIKTLPQDREYYVEGFEERGEATLAEIINVYQPMGVKKIRVIDELMEENYLIKL